MPKVIINRKKCEGKADCVKICPEHLFELKRPEKLGFLTRIKVNAHGGKQAYVKNEKDCTKCMKCVEACPEKALLVT